MILTAFCDLQFCPVSYDAVTFIVVSMLERDRRGCDGLHIVFVPNEQPGSLGGFSRVWGKHDEHAARWRLWHICVAACPLAGATVTVAASRAQAKAMEHDPSWWPAGASHFMGPLTEAARRGEKIPKLRATEAARRYVAAWLPRRFITMTLREQDTDPSRNSNLAAWTQLDNEARRNGFEVLRFDDVNKALAMGESYGADPDLRLAVYERAAMNFIGNNGPQELLKFSDAPYRTVGIGLGGWAEHFRKYFSMEVGEQLPWAGPQQRIVYEPESAEVLIREFKNWHGSQ